MDPDSYVIVVVDSHGGDLPSRNISGYNAGIYKIAAAGDCGYDSIHNLSVSHAIYSTCAEYNSQHLRALEASTTLSHMLKSSSTPDGLPTTQVISSKNGCPQDRIFNITHPTFDKLFEFSTDKQWERDNFGIFLVGHCDSAKHPRKKGVTNNPAINIKDTVFAKTGFIRATYSSDCSSPNGILLSTLTTSLKDIYQVSNVIIVDWTCRYTASEPERLGRVRSIPITTLPMETSDTPARVIPDRFQCPHQCPYCTLFGYSSRGGKLLNTYRKKSRSKGKINKNRKSKHILYR
jgi:hypothetical protein